MPTKETVEYSRQAPMAGSNPCQDAHCGHLVQTAQPNEVCGSNCWALSGVAPVLRRRSRRSSSLKTSVPKKRDNRFLRSYKAPKPKHPFERATLHAGRSFFEDIDPSPMALEEVQLNDAKALPPTSSIPTGGCTTSGGHAKVAAKYVKKEEENEEDSPPDDTISVPSRMGIKRGRKVIKVAASRKRTKRS
ncbi:hypothetical protein BU23DRAFT_626002 [Bimuria novae-zelandiae CBS 107.79]|uniref:Uncharacterized protein n=1 Tax=Bimuria novae-zelandiae CBS 107.79 TaxID=1447943 RepID=A0A6A5VSY2_9PLEO|nr:hypothetical protein BU23DRAFT_626002 [Bimuria novae-zelandiae CBS 107.79]